VGVRIYQPRLQPFHLSRCEPPQISHAVANVYEAVPDVIENRRHGGIMLVLVHCHDPMTAGSCFPHGVLEKHDCQKSKDRARIH